MAWHNLIKDDKSKILDFVDYFENELKDARQEVKISGNIEKALADLPGIFELRFAQLQEIEAVMESLENELRKLRSEKFQMYLEKNQRKLTSTDAWKYVDGNSDVFDLNEIINEVAYVRNQYLSVTKGLDQKSYMIGHITKLRCAGLEDAHL